LLHRFARNNAIPLDTSVAKPSNLPMQLATKYQLVLNLKTAKALGLNVPDEVIE
jgi:ABC-type uncharacterized transport system substrate-binding protein